MHSLQRDSIPNWWANHNGDFSGDVWIGTTDIGQLKEYGASEFGPKTVTLKVPFEFICAIVGEALMEKRIGELENMTDKEVLGL